MHRTFFGAFTTIEECARCQHRQAQTEEFDVVSLRKHYSLSVALQEYLLGQLSGPLIYCSACAVPSSVYARRTISSFPRILGIYINRFLDQAECKKNTSRVGIKEEMMLQGRKYRLYAFIEHKGSSQGYFMCYILLNNEWYEFNRENIVRDVNISLKLVHAIMVFYRLEHKS
jgi:ubiquitin C-terminal hydrolase